ncbi:MAG: tRNA (adenosine(37)-N6)-dimethylallyltransferase MiaA [Planctomycetales bacterium]|nr:tRNA (adenosine(37)-N6)-dimethylallyltransferase MiaA [Planctomycetales bacterium]
MDESLPAQNCWFLTGPTACGKTDVGMRLAERLGAEIVSLDSMAIYRGMDIGTAKPTAEQQQLVPHHLIDLVEPHEEFSLATYVEAAEVMVREIEARRRRVLFVGGTPLYLKALLRGIFAGPPADWQFRHEVEAELATVGQQALYDRLRSVDPLSASKLHPNDTRRLIRALEVYRATGQPISHLQMQFDEGLPAEGCRVFVLNRARAELHERIAKRVDWMLAAGFEAEVAGLLERPEPMSRTASQAVGYREMIDLVSGRSDRPTTIEKMRTRTRRFAKRQMTWFRSLCECRFVDLEGDGDIDAISARIQQLGSTVQPEA